MAFGQPLGYAMYVSPNGEEPERILGDDTMSVEEPGYKNWLDAHRENLLKCYLHFLKACGPSKRASVTTAWGEKATIHRGKFVKMLLAFSHIWHRAVPCMFFWAYSSSKPRTIEQRATNY